MKLPPLNALRAFDSAARLGSVKAAAGELFVTPAAISQQIRIIEGFIGTPLFERRPRELRLTATGQAYHQAITRPLRAISEATERLLPKRHSAAISVVPTFAALWLAPRLPRFTQLHPLVEIRIEADPSLVDFSNENFDMAIREGLGNYPGTETRMLFRQELLPVASPEYVRAFTRRKRFDWAGARLLHEGTNEFWGAWLEARDVKADTGKGLYFSHGMLAFAAAQAGEGVALAPLCLVERLLNEGRLQIVDPVALVTEKAYWLAWPRVAVRQLPESARLFRDWIIAQAASGPAPQPAGTRNAPPRRLESKPRKRGTS